jgi:hypothetical protein
MGADGGVRLTPISELRENWTKIREDVIRAFETQVKYSDEWARKWAVLSLEKGARELPEKIDRLPAYEIVELFGFARSCDCPYLIGETIMITAQGDYVAGDMNTLSMALPGDYVETWT